MAKKQFGTAEDYAKALASVVAEGIPEKHISLLQAHFEAPGHTLTARQLARAVGYPNYNSVNLQYGTLARRVASRLGVVEPPNGFWLFVLVDWANIDDPSGETLFVLRIPVVEGLKCLGYPWAK